MTKISEVKQRKSTTHNKKPKQSYYYAIVQRTTKLHPQRANQRSTPHSPKVHNDKTVSSQCQT